ncbi:MAG: hypothetical protein ACXWQO_10365, partial [Bdellovibrionota bacterium]
MPALALAMISIFFARAVPAIAEEHFPEKHSGIFQVSSSYNSTQTEVGTGFLVSYPAQSSGEKERAFLYTCAHLTGGSDVKINGVPLESLAKGRRTDTFHDVDLIEVDPGLLDGNAFATFSPTSSPEALNNPETIPVAEGVDTKTRLWSLAVNEASLAAWKKGKHSVLNVDYDGKNPAFALVPRWSDKAQAEASKPSQKKNWEFGTGGFRTLEKTYTFIGSSIWTPGRIAPGMSCSPLVDSENRHSQELVVRGMGTE